MAEETVKFTADAVTPKSTGNVPLTDLSAPTEAPVDNTSTGAVPGPPESVTYTSGIPEVGEKQVATAENKSMKSTKKGN